MAATKNAKKKRRCPTCGTDEGPWAPPGSRQRRCRPCISTAEKARYHNAKAVGKRGATRQYVARGTPAGGRGHETDRSRWCTLHRGGKGAYVPKGKFGAHPSHCKACRASAWHTRGQAA